MAKENTEPQSFIERIRERLLASPKNIKQLIDLIRAAKEDSVINTDSLNMIEGVLSINENQVRDIMIPRSEMIILKGESKPKETLSTITQSGHSRFPVAMKNQDKIIGILLAKDLLKVIGEDNNKIQSIHELTRPVKIVPESYRLNILLREFRNDRVHIAIVVNEYGETAGLITIEDVLEEIVGDIQDEFDKDESEHIIKKGENTFIVKASTPLEEFNDFFHTSFEHDNFETIAGLLLKNFSYFPKKNEQLTLNDIHFEIIKSSKKSIKEILVTTQSNTDI
jgi:magnesium and cobalt transporter